MNQDCRALEADAEKAATGSSQRTSASIGCPERATTRSGSSQITSASSTESAAAMPSDSASRLIATESCGGMGIAMSNRSATTAENTEATPANSARTLNSAGVYSRDSNGRHAAVMP